MFMREFPVIDAAVSVDQLRMRLKDDELEQYGEPLFPNLFTRSFGDYLGSRL